MPKKKRIYGMKIFFKSLKQKELSYALLPRQGKRSKGRRRRNAVSSASDMRSSYFCWVYKYTQTRKEEKLYYLQIYIAVVQFIFVLEMALDRGWSISEVHTRWSQFSIGNSMFLCLFRFQGSLGSAQSCGMFRDYCQHSLVKLTNFLCSLVLF